MNLEKNWFKRSHLLIAACGILFLVFAYTLERSQFWVLLSYYTLAFYLCWKIIETFKDKPRVLFYIGLGFRLLFLLAIPNLSQDFYRFIWDGRLLLQGLNPYLEAAKIWLCNMSGQPLSGTFRTVRRQAPNLIPRFDFDHARLRSRHPGFR